MNKAAAKQFVSENIEHVVCPHCGRKDTAFPGECYNHKHPFVVDVEEDYHDIIDGSELDEWGFIVVDGNIFLTGTDDRGTVFTIFNGTIEFGAPKVVKTTAHVTVEAIIIGDYLPVGGGELVDESSLCTVGRENLIEGRILEVYSEEWSVSE